VREVVAQRGPPVMLRVWGRVERVPADERDEQMMLGVDRDHFRYAREHLKTLRSGALFHRLLRQSCAAFLDRPIDSVTRSDIRRVLDRHMKRDRGSLANKVYSVLSPFFAWAVDRDLIPVSQMAGMARPMRRVVSRDRWLKDEELVANLESNGDQAATTTGRHATADPLRPTSRGDRRNGMVRSRP